MERIFDRNEQVVFAIFLAVVESQTINFVTADWLAEFRDGRSGGRISGLERVEFTVGATKIDLSIGIDSARVWFNC